MFVKYSTNKNCQFCSTMPMSSSEMSKKSSMTISLQISSHTSSSMSTKTLPVDPSFLFNCSQCISSGLNYLSQKTIKAKTNRIMCRAIALLHLGLFSRSVYFLWCLLKYLGLFSNQLIFEGRPIFEETRQQFPLHYDLY